MQAYKIQFISSNLLIILLCLIPAVTLAQETSESSSVDLVDSLQKQYDLDFSSVELNNQEKELTRAMVESSLKQFKDDERNLQLRGLSIIEKTRKHPFGVPLRTFYIRLDQVRAYQGGDPLKLLIPTNGLIVPIESKQNSNAVRLDVQSFAPLVKPLKELKNTARWRPQPPRKSKQYFQLINSRKELIQKQNRPEADCQCFGVHHVGLNQYFFGYFNESRKFMIQPLVDGSGSLKKGIDRPAEEVFSELAKEANQQKYMDFESPGNPRELFRQFQNR